MGVPLAAVMGIYAVGFRTGIYPDASPRSVVLFKGCKLLHDTLLQQRVPAADALKAVDDLQFMQTQCSVAPVVAAAMKAGCGLAVLALLFPQ